MKTTFLINSNLTLQTTVDTLPVKKAVERFYRDIKMTLDDSQEKGAIIKLQTAPLPDEVYRLALEEETLILSASDDLGFIYGLIDISQRYLGINPFWFWMDQRPAKKKSAVIENLPYTSEKATVPYRGWFINDEVLLHTWHLDGDKDKPWEMVFEALLRCHGNLVIPGTDKNSVHYRQLASDYGLWITHHHAEPLGAEMFSRAYPDKTASYDQHSDLYEHLWRTAIKDQSNYKVIWNIGFRGQGDCPFWLNDPSYDTPESRGALITSLIQKQYDLVKAYNPDAVCCTNLYGEVMELYSQGHIHLPPDVIRVWADNGYGKMVTRRQGNHNPRIIALPDANDRDGHHGAYYHASFYDLQAANHMTMSPVSPDFISQELSLSYEEGIRDMWLINCSNVKPHVFTLDLIRKFWTDGSVDSDVHLKEHLHQYYDVQSSPALYQELAECYRSYSDCTVPFGSEEDERAGEQLYNYTVRILASQWMKGSIDGPVPQLGWLYADLPFDTLLTQYRSSCQKSLEAFQLCLEKCQHLSEELSEADSRCFIDNFQLQVELHLYALQASVNFAEAFKHYQAKDYDRSFYYLGLAADGFKTANQAMRDREHDHWKNFYENDCLADFKQTAYLLERLMSCVRNLGEGPHFYHWQRKYAYSPEDRGVVLITNMENHMTDEEIFECMKMMHIED